MMTCTGSAVTGPNTEPASAALHQKCATAPARAVAQSFFRTTLPLLPMKPVALTLEVRHPNHTDELFAILSDPKLYEYVDTSLRPASPEALRARIVRNIGQKSPDGTEAWLSWMVRDEDGALVGTVEATIFPDLDVNIGYNIGSQHWGRGLARTAVAQMLAILRQQYQVKTFCIVAEQDNERSIRLARHLGFQPGDASARLRHKLSDTEVIWQLVAHQQSPYMGN